MISEYISPELYGAKETKLYNVIPPNSVILSIVVDVLNAKTGTVTLQTESVDSEDASRILFIDYINGIGTHTGNSAKEYFISNQNLMVKNTGEVSFKIKILFWEVNK